MLSENLCVNEYSIQTTKMNSLSHMLTQTIRPFFRPETRNIHVLLGQFNCIDLQCSFLDQEHRLQCFLRDIHVWIRSKTLGYDVQGMMLIIC